MSTESALTACLNECMKVAKGPQPKDIYDAQQWEMAGAHVVIMNGLLHLYKVMGLQYLTAFGSVLISSLRYLRPFSPSNIEISWSMPSNGTPCWNIIMCKLC